MMVWNMGVQALHHNRKTSHLIGYLALASWGWKTVEWMGRETGILCRQLGWGAYVDVTVPVFLTIAASVFFALESVVRGRHQQRAITLQRELYQSVMKRDLSS
jgi:hypothetical protein